MDGKDCFGLQEGYGKMKKTTLSVFVLLVFRKKDAPVGIQPEFFLL